MSQIWSATLAIGLLGMCQGCGSGVTRYPPQAVAQYELIPRYDGGIELWAAGQPVAEGYRYSGLTNFVGCVPEARAHASAAESDGGTAVGLSIAGGVLAGVGLAGLGGVAYKDTNTTAMAGFLISGIAVEVLAVTLAAIGRAHKTSANGHAIDAMNYYNDAVGSQGRRCTP